MYSCERCLKCFRDNYNLSSHLSRIIPCKVKTPEEKNILDIKKNLLDEKKSLLDIKKNSLDDKKNSCKYCLNEFSSKQYKSTHEMSCKQKDDPIRQLEIEQNINPILSASKTCCRYCDKELTRVSYLNKHVLICKERGEYLNLLENQKKSNTFITNNNIGTQNNITNNNNVYLINNIQSDLTHDLMEKIINFVNKTYPTLSSSEAAGEVLTIVIKRLNKDPKNRNAVLSLNRDQGKFITSDGTWEYCLKDECITLSVKQTAKHISTKIDTFESDLSDVDTSCEIDTYARYGLSHPDLSEDYRKTLKKKFSMKMLI